MNVIFLGLLTSDVIHIISISEFDTSQYVQGLCTSTQINSTDSGLPHYTYPNLAVLNKQNIRGETIPQKCESDSRGIPAGLRSWNP